MQTHTSIRAHADEHTRAHAEPRTGSHAASQARKLVRIIEARRWGEISLLWADEAENRAARFEKWTSPSLSCGSRILLPSSRSSVVTRTEPSIKVSTSFVVANQSQYVLRCRKSKSAPLLFHVSKSVRPSLLRIYKLIRPHIKVGMSDVAARRSIADPSFCP